MGSVAERMGRMSVRANSPDGSVRVRLTFHGLVVELRPDTASRHTDRSLARQVEAALTSAFGGYEQAVDGIRTDLAEGRPAPVVDDLPDGHPRRRLDARASRLEVVAYSVEDYVSLTWRGKKAFRVELRPGTVRALSDGELAAELNSVVANAARERAGQLREVRREMSGSDFR